VQRINSFFEIVDNTLFMIGTEIFISYKWNDISETEADKIEEILIHNGFKVVRDRNEQNYKDLISKFIQRLSNAKYVVAVVSDEYLKSESCIKEMYLLFKKYDFKDRIFPIILNDAQIYNTESALEYILYWERKQKDLEDKIKSLKTQTHLKPFHEKLDFLSEIRQHISSMLGFLKDINVYNIKENNYIKLIQEIQKKISTSKSAEIATRRDTKGPIRVNMPIKEHSRESLGKTGLVESLGKLSDMLENSFKQEYDLQIIYELQSKIYDPIFSQFKKKLSANDKDKAEFVEILFNRIINYDLITDLDKSYIQDIRTSNDYEWYEKSVLVSALTIASLNKFDPNKIDILIDFSINSDEEVWRKAFVGLVLSVRLHQNKISSFPNLEKSLKRIIQSNKHQITLSRIDRILRKKTYSISAMINQTDTASLFAKMKGIMPEFFDEVLELDESDFENKNNESDELVETNIVTYEDYMDVERLKQDYLNGQTKLTMQELLTNYVDFKEFFTDNEGNYLSIPLEELNTFNWFLPFYKENSALKEFVLNAPDEIEDAREFLAALENSKVLNSIDKYYLASELSSNSAENSEVAEMLLAALSFEAKQVFTYDGYESSILASIIREIYRFVKFYEVNQKSTSLFTKETDIQKNRLSSEVYMRRIKGMYYYDKGEFELAEKEIELYLADKKDDRTALETLILIKKDLFKSDEVIHLLQSKIDTFLQNKNNEIFDTLFEVLNIQKEQSKFDEALNTISEMEGLFKITDKNNPRLGLLLLHKALVLSRMSEQGKNSEILHLQFKSFSIFINNKEDYFNPLRYIQFNMLFKYLSIGESIGQFLKEEKELLQYIENDIYRKKYSEELIDFVENHFNFITNNITGLNSSESNVNNLVKVIKSVAQNVIDNMEKDQYERVVVPLLYENNDFTTLTLELSKIFDDENHVHEEIYSTVANFVTQKITDFDFVENAIGFDEDYMLKLDEENVNRIYDAFTQKIEHILTNLQLPSQKE